ncbi:hypothetical protein [Pseudomonas abietaniphila]|uniref:hypothetical protein n=1 Tax=Pseudomonas abietaniphila TaxID=89065 RepID=UPI000AE36310|nr:hypothetical protein [Pseudomonas abietaniphila]
MSRDLPGTGSKICACGVSGIKGSPGFAAAARQIVRVRPRDKPRSYTLQAEAFEEAVAGFSLTIAQNLSKGILAASPL